jgi:hypothetical protein
MVTLATVQLLPTTALLSPPTSKTAVSDMPGTDACEPPPDERDQLPETVASAPDAPTQ